MIAAIQAGGRSTRMGRDKAWLTVDGQPLIARALAAARPLADRLLVVIAASSLQRARYAEFARVEHAELVIDETPDCGPLAGIHAALKHATGLEDVLVLACDLPFVTTPFLEVLRDAHVRHGKQITVPLDPEGRLQPLLAIYSSECLAQIEEQLSRKLLRVDRLFEHIPTYRLRPLEYSHIENSGRIFANINTPGDLAQFCGGAS
jgi:molybdopterin-guanine dinucleotide biosynthesis protein A